MKDLGDEVDYREISDTHNISTVSILGTLLGSQLHETLFAIATDGFRIAATLLEGDRGQKGGRNLKRTVERQFCRSTTENETYVRTPGQIA
jgi:hypothetical protein